MKIYWGSADVKKFRMNYYYYTWQNYISYENGALNLLLLK